MAKNPNLIEVTRCEQCIFYIGSEYSNTGHCSMWNKASVKNGYCHRAETEVTDDESETE